ncbi:molybdate ABC transporter substrate-binding protein [Fredinandcohnia humi]
MKRILSYLLLVFIITGCVSPNSDKESNTVELTVSAAASMQNVLNDIKEAFEKENPSIRIGYNFGASGSLQQQISQGAPVDLFLSASVEKFDKLVKEGIIDASTQHNLVGNEIVLIVPKGREEEIHSFGDLLKAESISIGTPESVPVGKYAKDVFENMGLWRSIEEKMIYAKDARQVLTYVETANVNAGVVYKTDAILSDKVTIVTIADKYLHSSIVYPLGVINTSTHKREAKQFYEYLQSEKALNLFEDYGFLILE